MKKDICVIFGGESPQHDISQISVTSVLNNLDQRKYNIHTVGITRDGRWFLYTGDWPKITSGEWENDTEHLVKAFVAPDVSYHGLIIAGNRREKQHIDVFFPVLHGEYGELLLDGRRVVPYLKTLA